MSLTQEQQATNFDTLQHIQKVQHNLNIIIKHLLERGENHDASKLIEPEVEAFTEHTANLHGLTFGSKEYHDQLIGTSLKSALEHHYANNRHHPQHFKNGIYDMTIIDLVEMFCDWAASTKRHHDGNLRKSLEHNAVRFNISPQLCQILENSIELFDQ